MSVRHPHRGFTHQQGFTLIELWNCGLLSGDPAHVPQTCRREAIEVLADILGVPVPP